MRNFLIGLVLTAWSFGTQFVEPSHSATGGLATPWVEGHNSRARLVAGGSAASAAGLLAGVEVEMPDGWKTYWRSPGDAGGVPPAFDWSKSENLANAEALYPAPEKFTDRSGNTLGYKNDVVFPVRLNAADPAKPVKLNLRFEYGICKDICIPAEAALSLTIPANNSTALPVQLSAAIERVPRTADAAKPSDPVLERMVAELQSANPHLLLETRFPAGAGHIDAFLEAPAGLYVPLPKKTGGDDDGRVTFEVDLSNGVDIEDLRGETLTLTLVSDAGQSEVPLQLP